MSVRQNDRRTMSLQLAMDQLDIRPCARYAGREASFAYPWLAARHTSPTCRQ